MDVSLPYSVIQGETFSLKATVFNYLKDCIQVSSFNRVSPITDLCLNKILSPKTSSELLRALDAGIWATKQQPCTLWPRVFAAWCMPNPMCACMSNHAQVHTTLMETPELKVDACPSCQFTSCLCANEAKTFVWNVTATRLGEAGQRDCVAAPGSRGGICPRLHVWI